MRCPTDRAATNISERTSPDTAETAPSRRAAAMSFMPCVRWFLVGLGLGFVLVFSVSVLLVVSLSFDFQLWRTPADYSKKEAAENGTSSHRLTT